ncbi:hypothetical protein D9758_013593 [Tetrapyrgos nigripes]|uniref:Uncharacterized protein n=1 Tax=Tetrapyrgos nigripes TaxID=182062 RepID=A0A8H5FHJ6_9AGAR|nr:hypothetical protein D9758_013593 [Tetrapyrgos nigripes]
MLPLIDLGYSSATLFKFSASAVIFDLDGTLTNSTPVSTPPLSPDDTPPRSRRSSVSSVSFIRRRRSSFAINLQRKLFELSLDGPVRICYEEFEEDLKNARANCPIHLQPGAMALVESLVTECDRRYAVMTAGTAEYASNCITRAEIPIPQVIVTNEDQSPADTEPMVLAAQKIGFPLSECAVFVNTPSQVCAALASGAAKVVAVCSSHDRAELEKYHPHYVVDTLEAVQCSFSAESDGLRFAVLIPGNPSGFPHMSLEEAYGRAIC